MRLLGTSVALAVAALLAPSAQAQIVINDTSFSGAAWGGPPITTFGPTAQVALVGGSGQLTRNAAFALPSAGLYQLSFDLTLTGAAAPSTYSVGTSLSGTGPSINFGTISGSLAAFPFNSTSVAPSYLFYATAPVTTYNLAYSLVASAATTFTFDNVKVEQVPGPLPVIGALAAFGWSRKLRKKVKESDDARSLQA